MQVDDMDNLQVATKLSLATEMTGLITDYCPMQLSYTPMLGTCGFKTVVYTRYLLYHMLSLHSQLLHK